MISASGRDVATTCQYSPGAGSFVTDARGAGCDGCGFGSGVLVSFVCGGAGCAGCVAAGSDGEGLVSAGAADGSCGVEAAGCEAPLGRSTTIALPGSFRADSEEAIGPEFRPTMYPMEKNTASRITTIRNTLIS